MERWRFDTNKNNHSFKALDPPYAKATLLKNIFLCHPPPLYLHNFGTNLAHCQTPYLPGSPSPWKDWKKSGEALYLGSWLFGWLVDWSQRWADTNGTLAFEDAHVILPFSREETYLGHIWVISGTYLGHILETSGTFWDISEIYLGISWAYITTRICPNKMNLSKRFLDLSQNILNWFLNSLDLS